MSMARVSDPSEWCFAEIDRTSDGDGIDRLLEALEDMDASGAHSGAATDADRDATRARIAEAMEVLQAAVAEGPTVVPARRLVNRVLELWELADEVDPAASAPLEALLSHLVGRHSTTADEVVAALAEARSALADPVPVDA